jgi:hypothetical protein
VRESEYSIPAQRSEAHCKLADAASQLLRECIRCKARTQPQPWNQRSQGSYIVFLDADDRLLPEAIKMGLDVLQARPERAMTIGDHVFVCEDGSYLARSRKEFRGSFHYEALLISNFNEMISSVLFRLSVFEAVGGFNTRLRVAEDYELYLRITRDFPVCCHTSVVAEYRQHKSNVSHNSELMLTQTLQVLKREARHIFGDIRRLDAFLEGLRTWRRQYGRQLTAELARSFLRSSPALFDARFCCLLTIIRRGCSCFSS